MWTTFAFVAVLGLAPAQAGQLDLTNVRNTYGVLGAPRPDSKFLPGDNFVLSFDIEGLQVDDAGKVSYSVAMEVSDADGQVRLKQAPRKQEATNSLGGATHPAYAEIKIGLDQPPGTYQMKITVSDLAAKAKKTLTRSFEVLQKGFGMVRLSTTSDPAGKIPAPVAATGQSLYINFGAVGFKRDGDSKQPNLAVALSVKDEDGGATLARPFTGEISKDIPANAQAVPMQFLLDLNRPGKFTVELKATDKVSGDAATVSFPFTVLKTK
jgi:hypothetical protein